MQRNTRRSVGEEADSFIDYGTIDFTMHSTTQKAEYCLVHQSIQLAGTPRGDQVGAGGRRTRRERGQRVHILERA
jgi:hypothetical protein